MGYLIVIEKAGNNWSGYLPDVPGCVATGQTPDEVRQRLKEALDMHLDGLREDGLPIPEPTARSDYLPVQ